LLPGKGQKSSSTYPNVTAQIWLSPTGSDSNEGVRIDSPLFTLNQVRELVRRNNNMFFLRLLLIFRCGYYQATKILYQNSTIYFLGGRYDWGEQQNLSRPAVLQAWESSDVVLTSSTINAGAFLNITASVSLVNISLNFSQRNFSSLDIIYSNVFGVSVSLINVSIECNASISSCTPMRLTGTNFTAQSLSITVRLLQH
jgi:hypothetical protein